MSGYSTPPAETLYTFHISAGGVATNLPEGWTVTRTAAGQYRVTHNLGFSAPTNAKIFPVACKVSYLGPINVMNLTSNYFDIGSFSMASAYADSDVCVHVKVLG